MDARESTVCSAPRDDRPSPLPNPVTTDTQYKKTHVWLPAVAAVWAVGAETRKRTCPSLTRTPVARFVYNPSLLYMREEAQ